MIINKIKKSSRPSERRFYYIMYSLPILQFLIFYVLVNVNSIFLAFQFYDYQKGIFVFMRSFDNFKMFFIDAFNGSIIKEATINSLLLYFFGLVISVPGSLFFSFYIYKKMKMHKFFKIMLFLPSIISIVVMVIMFKYMVDRAIPDLINTLFGIRPNSLLGQKSTLFPTIIFFNLWIGFGSSVLLYTGGMSSISDSIVDSTRLENITLFKEFWYITLPMIFPTICTLVTVGIVGIFTNQGNVYSFFMDSAPTYANTLGYYIFIKTIGQKSTFADYPYAAAAGLVFTGIAFPLTYIVKFILDKTTYKLEH